MAGIAAFLANPVAFNEWKHRQSSDYVGRTQLSVDERKILSLLALFPSADFEAITSSLNIDIDDASDALQKLTNSHIIEIDSDLFSITPTLRVAIERDKRIGLDSVQRTRALTALSETLSMRIDEGTASTKLVDTAVLSSIERNISNPLVAAFLLPSHYVWLAKRNYDQRNFAECIRLSKEALKSGINLSRSGFVAACRFMCLAASRQGERDVFDDGIRRLQVIATESWARSNIAFLKGFNERLKGNLPVAENHFVEAYRLSPGNFSATRELAAICLVRGDLSNAETYAREAYASASSNPYLIDILIAVLVKKLGKNALRDQEVRHMLDTLEKFGEEEGKSFFSTRSAEIEHLWGDNRVAKSLIEEAIKKTPTIFEPRRIYAEILIKDGNKVRALEVINWMRERVNSRDPAERRSNYRLYLETYAHYLAEIKEYEEAKAIYDDQSVFTDQERKKAVKEIEIGQSYRDQRQ